MLTADRAHDLLNQIFSGQVTDLEIGAFCLAMRIKGETVDELDGSSALPANTALPLADAQTALQRPVVVLPRTTGLANSPTSPHYWDGH